MFAFLTKKPTVLDAAITSDWAAQDTVDTAGIYYNYNVSNNNDNGNCKNAKKMNYNMNGKDDCSSSYH